MADTAKRLYTIDDVPNVATTAYTVPAATTTHMRGINVANKTGAAITIRVTAAGTQVLPDVSVPGNGVLSWEGLVTLLAAETVVVQASAATGLAIHIAGVETT